MKMNFFIKSALAASLAFAGVETVAASAWGYSYYPSSSEAAGQLASVDGPRVDVNDVTQYLYDEHGNLAKVINPLGHITHFTDYDTEGRVTRVIDPNGVVFLYEYDLRGRIVSQNKAGSKTSFEYDAVGNLVKLVRPGGNELGFAYDAGNRLVSVTDASDNVLRYSLDAAGNITGQTEYDSAREIGFQQSKIYDELSNLRQIVGSQGQTQQINYDVNGNQVSSTDANQNTSNYGIDALGRLVQVIDAALGVTSFDYAPSDRIQAVTDARGNTTRYSYDPKGNLVRLESPDAGVSTFGYDAAGNRTQMLDAKGQLTEYTYDVLNRLVLSKSSEGYGEALTLKYDQGKFGIGKLTALADSKSSTQFTYTARGEVESQSLETWGRSYTVAYNYNASDELVTTTYPSGRKVIYRLSGGQITDIRSIYKGKTQALVQGVTYSPSGALQGLVYGNGLDLQHSFNLDYQIETLANEDVAELKYERDPAGNILVISNDLDVSQSQSFKYDSLWRLIQAKGSYGDIAYTYDSLGNRVAEIKNSENKLSQGYQFSLLDLLFGGRGWREQGQQDRTVENEYLVSPASNRLIGVEGDESLEFRYDANGNVVQKGRQYFSYDQQNRLIRSVQRGKLGLYAYNGLGQRIRKQVNAKRTVFVYDQTGHLIAEHDGRTGLVRVEYIWLGDKPVAMTRYESGRTKDYYLHSDHLNTPFAVTDERGRLFWQAVYEPFGVIRKLISKIEFNLRFPGQYYDFESDLNYNYFRSYDPDLGRYLRSDPIGLAGGLNTYIYVLGNPLMYSDPYGLLNPTKYATGLFNTANSLRKSATAVVMVRVAVLAGVLGQPEIALPAAGIAAYNAAGAKAAAGRGGKQIGEGLAGCWEDANWRNFMGVLPMGTEFDDPDEPWAWEIDLLKDKSAGEIFGEAASFL